MKKAVIYYFSGTGNMGLIANMVNDELTRCNYTIDMVKIEDVLKNKLKIEPVPYELIGIGCPVIGFGIPNVIKDFLKIFPKGSGQKVFVFRNAGGVHPINFNASKLLISKLSKKGYDVSYERLFAISSNWCVRFSDEITQKLYEATRRKVALMCREIVEGKRHLYKTGAFLRIRMGIVRAFASLSFRIIAKDYRVNQSCKLCGLCIKNCPSNNIRIKNDKIKFGLHCSACMRCVYTCPKRAIEFKLFKFFRVPGEYNIQKILSNNNENEKYSTERNPPFFQEYYNNDNF